MDARRGAYQYTNQYANQYTNQHTNTNTCILMHLYCDAGGGTEDGIAI